MKVTRFGMLVLVLLVLAGLWASRIEIYSDIEGYGSILEVNWMIYTLIGIIALGFVHTLLKSWVEIIIAAAFFIVGANNIYAGLQYQLTSTLIFPAFGATFVAAGSAAFVWLNSEGWLRLFE